MEPEFLSELIGHTINRVIVYKIGQERPIHFGSLKEENLEWESLAFDKSVVNLHVLSYDTADLGAEKFDSLWPKYTKSGYQIYNESGITLRDLTEGIYRMHGLEYPWYCARYRGIQITYKSSESVVVTVKFHYMK